MSLLSRLTKSQAGAFPETAFIDAEAIDVSFLYGVRIHPRWFIITPEGRHAQSGDAFSHFGLANGRLSFSFDFIAQCALHSDSTVRVEFPEFSCAREFPLGAFVATGEYHVVASHLDLKPAFVKLGEGTVKTL